MLVKLKEHLCAKENENTRYNCGYRNRQQMKALIHTLVKSRLEEAAVAPYDDNTFFVVLNYSDQMENASIGEKVRLLSALLSRELTLKGCEPEITCSGFGCGFQSWFALCRSLFVEQKAHGESSGGFLEEYKKREEGIMDLLASSRPAEAGEELKRLTPLWDSLKHSDGDLFKMCLSFYRALRQYTERYGLSMDSPVIPPSQIDWLMDVDEIQDAVNWMIRLVDIISVKVNGEKKDKSSKVFERAVDIILDRYRENISCVSLCRELLVSENYLKMTFKWKTGKSVSAYLNEIRLQKACELLTSTAQPISEIPRLVGLADSPYFYALFKKNTGTTPSEYRFLYGRKEADKT
jgi:AraC-like DNA-binding protein